MKLKIYVLTYCKDISQLYGNTLIFKTLRVGFPTAEVVLIDNNSVSEARPTLSNLARKNNCNYFQLNSDLLHHQFLSNIIKLESLTQSKDKEVVFLDPDIVFWDKCEDWDLGDCLIGGRLIPRFKDEYSKSITESRIHTSFLWIKDCGLFVKEMEKIRDEYMDFEPFIPVMVKNPDNNLWWRYDAGSSLYHALPKNKIFHFGEKELNSYDHIFCGSDKTVLEYVMNSLQDEGDKTILKKIHETANTDYTKLKGIWRVQENYFKQRQVS